MSSKSIIPLSYSKRNPQSQRPQAQRSKPRRPHGKPQPTRYKPPAPPRPTRYALDVGRNISLSLTLARYNIRPNAATVARIGGAE